MTDNDAEYGAKSILEIRTGQKEFKVLVDNPNDCSATIKAFKKLGCRVKSTHDGSILIVTRSEA